MTDKPRSIDQHRRFFGLCRALFHHWPETVEFQPDNEEHLRAFLLVKAGYRSVKTFFMSDNDVASECAHVVPIISAMMLHRYCWAWVDQNNGNAIHVAAPESTAFDKLSHAKACAVYEAVDQFVRSLGIDPDEVLKETESAA